jgi:hypothetical protein
MLALLLGLLCMVLFGKDHRGVVLENIALRQQLSVYKCKHERPRFAFRAATVVPPGLSESGSLCGREPQ